MCTQVQWFSTHLVMPVLEGIQHSLEAVDRGTVWLGKKIDDLTGAVLPRCAAVVAAAAIKSFPFIAMRLFLPTPLFLTGLGIILGHKIITTPKGKPATAQTVENGFAFAGLWQGGSQIAQGFAANTLPPILFGVANMVASLFLFLRTGLVNDMCSLPSSAGNVLPNNSPKDDVAAEHPAQEPATVTDPDTERPGTSAATSIQESERSQPPAIPGAPLPNVHPGSDSSEL